MLHLDCIKVLCITPFCRLSRYRVRSQEDNISEQEVVPMGSIALKNNAVLLAGHLSLMEGLEARYTGVSTVKFECPGDSV